MQKSALHSNVAVPGYVEMMHVRALFKIYFIEDETNI